MITLFDSSSFYSVISYSLDSFLYMFCSGIDGPGVMRLICGIRTAGMNHRTRKEDKVLPLPLLSPISSFSPNLSLSFWLHISYSWYCSSLWLQWCDAGGIQLYTVYLGAYTNPLCFALLYFTIYQIFSLSCNFPNITW